MSCPTCGHTMENVRVIHEPYTDVPVYWCSRCGTLEGNVITEEDEVPKLVQRVRELLTSPTPWRTFDAATRTGVLESIWTPEELEGKNGN